VSETSGPGGGETHQTHHTHPTLLVALTAITVVSGLNDAVSYLGLGRVFTANMTGNIVVLGFAAAAAPGFSVRATLTSIGVFLVGAVIAGAMARSIQSRRTLLLRALWIEAIFTAAAAVVAGLGPDIGAGWQRYSMIALLAFAMGVRNSMVRRLSIPDVTTTVLTGTLTGLAADSKLAGGNNERAGRRVGAVLSMFAGAFVGALLLRHINAVWPLGISSGVVAVAALILMLRPRDELEAPQ
jgi:uncharacterized membrane protein YoaK (UPF0700 family)